MDLMLEESSESLPFPLDFLKLFADLDPDFPLGSYYNALVTKLSKD
jgi:hypothetical protein